MKDTWMIPDQARSALQQGLGRDVKVAVLDSGIETTHPVFEGVELADNVITTDRESSAWFAENGDGDCFGHGTAVAAMILRLAPEATLGSFRVLGGPPHQRDEAIRRAARLAIDRGYHILHCSFGTVGSPLTIMSFKDWVDEAFIAGTHVVAACHNQNHRLRVWPAHFTSVIAVDSIISPQFEILFSRADALVEFATKGREKVLLPWSGGREDLVEGTSFSAPIVTGLLARLLSIHPGLRPEKAKALLKAIAEPLPIEQ